MDFKLKITEEFKLLADKDRIPGTVNYSNGSYVYQEFNNSSRSFSQIPSEQYIVRSDLSDSIISDYGREGLSAISKGELTVLVLCGGQASRLGADKPKGTFDLGLPSPFSTLLEIQISQIVRLKELAKREFPDSEPKLSWFIMVSQSTNKDITAHIQHLCAKYEYPWADVVIFEQREVPAFSFDGKHFVDSFGNPFTAPSMLNHPYRSCYLDGNGGIYDSLAQYIPELEKRGSKFIHTYCVDNVLCRVGDPVFVGASIKSNADCAAKVVEKMDPKEKVGVICVEQGHPTVVEYTELPENLANLRTDDGAHLVYRAGSIANHFFTLEFLKRACNLQLPYHIARKKIPYYDNAKGAMVKPETENGVKLERFIFDVFEISKNFLVFQVDREEEFSPLKNPDSVGKDCPSTCRDSLLRLHSQWLTKANIPSNLKLLVSPLSSYAGEDITAEKIEKALGKPLVLNL